MIALNNTSIFVGQIKQLLHDFNLPLCHIGNKNIPLNSYYLSNNAIYYRNSSGADKRCYEYDYNTPYLNVTSNLVIENMIYDRSTHEYLGKYLRFLRDYNNVNLMSMYNCFGSDVLESAVLFEIEVPIVDPVKIVEIEFSSNNKEYVVYKIPVSLVDVYSISLHNTKNIEVCLYDEADSLKPDDDTSKYNLCKLTYKKIQAANVVYYEPDVDIAVPNNLYMLLKLPRDLNTSITVLEGRYYSSYNNLNVLPIGNEINLNIAAQLLSTENTHGNNLLADRIIEYLTGSVICKLSEPYDIKRMQIALDSLYKHTTPNNNPPIPKVTGRLYGIWDDRDLELIKYLALKNKLIKYDSLCYIDKDIETYLVANTNFDNIEFNVAKGSDDSAINI